MVQYLNNKASGFQGFSKMKDSEPKKGMGLFGWTITFLIIYWIFGPEPKKVELKNNDARFEQVDISKVKKDIVKSDKVSATVQGLRISNIELKDYKEKDGLVKLLNDNKEFIEVGLVGNGTALPVANSNWNNGTWKSDTGVSIKRTVKADNYIITVSDEIKNNSGRPVSISQYSRIVKIGGTKNSFAVAVGGITNIDGKVENESWDDIKDESPIYQTTNDNFVGFTDQYWQTIIASKEQSDKTIKLKTKDGLLFQSEIAPEFVSIDAGKTKTIETKIFAGPKTQEVLLEGSKQIANLDRSLDYGFFGFLSRPMLWTLNELHALVHNYGISIILLTILIRLLIWPISKKAYKSMASMQKLQPEMSRIQKLYGNDKMRMQQEIMSLYQTTKVNPFSSIGLMLLQIPIFFAVYKSLVIAVPLRGADFLWLHDLSMMDPYFVLPVLMSLTMWLQNKLSYSNSNADVPGMKFIKWLPWIFGFLFAFMPSGLVLYWTVSNIVGIIQMRIIKK